MEITYYNILLPVPTEGVYTYFSEGLLHTGERVVVPFRKREITGIVLEKIEKPDCLYESLSISCGVNEISGTIYNTCLPLFITFFATS